MSPKTVEANLARVYRKLGIRSRAELGARIEGRRSHAAAALPARTPGQASSRELGTILFTDLVGSTERARTLGDAAWASLLSAHNDAVRRELARFSGEEIDTAGDGFLAFFDGPGQAIRCALAIREELRALELPVRAGVHTGEVERKSGDKPRGIAVHVGARLMSLAGAGEVLVSSTTRDLVAGSGLEFEDRRRARVEGDRGSTPRVRGLLNAPRWKCGEDRRPGPNVGKRPLSPRPARPYGRRHGNPSKRRGRADVPRRALSTRPHRRRALAMGGKGA